MAETAGVTSAIRYARKPYELRRLRPLRPKDDERGNENMKSVKVGARALCQYAP